ncbi:PA4642 family protein [Gilvimarinus sp. F26214L]|uniref:PA4642 family protein n=1 Tax=Gilvimarinus sp. DZF01 TaxID=3461371 RepID=UPI0040461B66
MALRKDKKKVVGEHFDDDRIRSFLNFEAPPGVNPDFHILEKAYRGMIPENFATFVKFFVEAGRDINATDPSGTTLLQQVETHRYGDDYAQALKAAGAR